MLSFKNRMWMRKVTLALGLMTLALAFNNCTGNFKSSAIPTAGNEDPNGNQEEDKDTRPLTCDVQPVTINHTDGFVAGTTQTQFIDTNDFPLALCNDGSPAVFSIREGYGEAKSRWIIFFDGGASCWDQRTCTERANETPDLISSNAYKTLPFGINFGVVSPDPLKNPDLYDSTMVRVHYCSSDGWTGNKKGDLTKPGVIPDSWHFQGHEIVKAVIHTLQNKYNLNQAQELLMVGSSAGGVGTFNNLSWVQVNIPASIRFVAANDAGFINQVAGYDQNEPDGINKAGTSPYNVVNPIQVSTWNATGDIFCEKTAVTLDERIQCGMGPRLAAKDLNQIRVPMFVRQALADGVQLKQEGLDIQSNPPKQQSQSYQLYFAQEMRNSINNSNNFISAFAALSNVHGQMDNTDYFRKAYTFGVAPNDVTLTISQALGIWYKDPCKLPKWMQ